MMAEARVVSLFGLIVSAIAGAIDNNQHLSLNSAQHKGFGINESKLE